MTFNIPITISADVSEDSVNVDSAEGQTVIHAAFDLTDVHLALNENNSLSGIRCAHCGEDLDEDDPTRTLHGGETECPNNDDGPHQMEYAPLTWAKNITISLDEEDDRIELVISTGDPRGGWSFVLRRTPDGAVMMHLPHAEMGDPHEPIQELRPGTFVIG